MKKFLVTFYTNVIINNKKDEFTMIVEADENAPIVGIEEQVGQTLRGIMFIKADNGMLYRSDHVTNYKITELEEL